MPSEQKNQPDRRGNRTILGRTIMLMVIFGVLLFIPLFVKLFNIQITQHDHYEQLAIDQQTKDMAVSANRGVIYDSKGTALAMSATAYDIILSPRDIDTVQKSYADAVQDYADGKRKKPVDWPEPTDAVIAQKLSEILGIGQEKVLARLAKSNSLYERLAIKVEESVADQVRAFITEYHLANGLYCSPTSKRHYPLNDLAAQVIGFVNSENQGAYGMEAIYDTQLAGETGRVVTAKNGKGTEMLSRYENYYDATNGNNLHITIDSTIQYFCEKALEKGIAMYDVQNGGFCIAMDPKTGAILAWANAPDYNLNTPSVIQDAVLQANIDAAKATYGEDSDQYSQAVSDARQKQWRNKAINDTYEPGSTFKSMVLAAALEEGVVHDSDTFYCSGSVMVDGFDKPIRCSKREGHGSQTLAQAVANSCNPAFIAIGQRLGKEKFYDYLEAFGMTQLTEIDMQGEASSNIWQRKVFTNVDLAVASFGQRFNVTPIQMITAASSVINGGHLMQPYVLQSITAADGSVIENTEPTEVRQVVSEQTSQRCREILEGVVNGGTGKNAYQAGYRIGGKTGSSETGEDDHTIVSFLGFAPADDPQVVILLAYDNPKPAAPGGNWTPGGVYISGGNMGAPRAGELLANILDHLGVEKQYTAEELTRADVLVPNVTGLTAADAQRQAATQGLTVRTVGEGETVTDQMPAQGASVPGGSQIVLYLGEAKPTDQVVVPDVTGKSPTAAQDALTAAGLYMKADGALGSNTNSTMAAGQSIDAGTSVERGTVVKVQFIDNVASSGWGF